MPTDPRMVAAASSPNAAPVSAAALNNVFVALMDLSRRIDRVEASRTVIQADTITSTHIAAGSIHASEIEVGNIVASIMTVGAVNASHIDANSIRTSILNATQIIAQGLQTEVLNAVKAAVTDLSSVSANTGTLTASLIRTDVSPNARVEIGTTAGGIKGYNSSNALTFGFDVTTGAATVGSITVTGANGTQVPASTLTGFVGGGNLLIDSSFESPDPATPASLWSLSSATMAKSTTQSFHGTTSLRVTYGSGTNSFVFTDLVAKHGVPITSLRSRPLVVSAWVWVDTTATTLAGLDRTLVAFDNTGASAVALASNLTKGQWNRVVVKMTPGAAATFVDIALTAAYSNGPIYYDGVQVEFGDAATAYSPKGNEVIYGSITTLELAANAVKATNLDAGAITADKISLGVPASASIRNGNFNEGNPTTGSTLANGWTLQVGNAATVQTDTAWPRIARLVNATNIGSAMTQDVTLPLGRSVLRLWVKTTSVANAVPGTSGATLSVVAGTGTGTIGAATRIIGTTGWTLIERDVTVTAVGTFAVRFRLDDAGTADFANFHIIPAITGTTLTPTSIDTMTITLAAGGKVQTASSGARVTLDSTGLTAVDASANQTFSINSAGTLALTGTIKATGLTLNTGTGVGQAASLASWVASSLSNNQTLAMQSWYTGSAIFSSIFSGYAAATVAGQLQVGALAPSPASMLFKAGSTAGTAEITFNLNNGSDRRLVHTDGTSYFVRAPNPVDNGTAHLAMAISVMRSVTVTVPAAGTTNGTISGYPGNNALIFGELTGTNSALATWGRTSATNVMFYNYHPTVPVTITLNYFWLGY